MQQDLMTARLLLRSFNESDVDELWRLVNDREIASTTLTIPHPYERSMAEEWIRKRDENPDHVNYAITSRRDGQLIGTIGLRIYREHHRAELGYWVGVPFWRKGYATEAVGAIVSYAFSTLDLNKVFAGYFPRNPASGRVLEKVGMKRDGVLRQHVIRWGVFEDVIICSILKSEWMNEAD